MHISMHPTHVRAWGRAAHGVGEYVRGQRSKVAAAGDEPAPVDAFEFSGAFTGFFSTWEGVVGGLGDAVTRVGTNLVNSANTVSGHDADGCSEIRQTWTRTEHLKRPFIGPRVPH